MRNDLADVTLIVDRSGSMKDCRLEAENGVNIFIDKQREQPGECLLSLVQFDTEYEFVHKGTPIADVGPYNLDPRGMTALLDAVGRAINEAGIRFSAMAEEDRPGLVVFVIVTDGKENASHEFTKTQIKEMIEHQQSIYSWQFTFLGANQDAFDEGASIAIGKDATANFNTTNSMIALAAASNNVSRMRSARACGQCVMNAFTDDERDSMQ